MRKDYVLFKKDSPYYGLNMEINIIFNSDEDKNSIFIRWNQNVDPWDTKTDLQKKAVALKKQLETGVLKGDIKLCPNGYFGSKTCDFYDQAGPSRLSEEVLYNKLISYLVDHCGGISDVRAYHEACATYSRKKASRSKTDKSKLVTGFVDQEAQRRSVDAEVRQQLAELFAEAPDSAKMDQAMRIINEYLGRDPS